MSQSCVLSKCYPSIHSHSPTESNDVLNCLVAAVKSSVVSALSFFGVNAM